MAKWCVLSLSTGLSKLASVPAGGAVAGPAAAAGGAAGAGAAPAAGMYSTYLLIYSLNW